MTSAAPLPMAGLSPSLFWRPASHYVMGPAVIISTRIAMTSFKKILWLILPVILCGCDSPAERLFKEQIQITNEAADRRESGKWDAVYGQSISSRMMANLYKQEKLKIPAEERKRLEEKYGPEMEKAQARLTAATEKMNGKPHK